MNTNTTTRTRKAVAQIAASIDLTERATPRTLDDLLADDRAIVDVWTDGDPDVVLLGDEAAVTLHTGDVDGAMALVEARLHRGWGREGALPESIEVARYDGERPDLANATSGIFVEHKREAFASWRLIEEVVD